MAVPPVDAFEWTIPRWPRSRQPMARASTPSQGVFEAAIMTAWGCLQDRAVPASTGGNDERSFRAAVRHRRAEQGLARVTAKFLHERVGRRRRRLHAGRR